MLRCYPCEPEDGHIDRNRSNFPILRLVNASDESYSGVYCKFRGKKFIILSAELVEDGEGVLAAPDKLRKLVVGLPRSTLREGSCD